MIVIRDLDFNGLAMIPLWNKYNLHRCNVRDCKEKQTTIVVDLAEQPFALCEHHYLQARTSSKIECTLDFD